MRFVGSHDITLGDGALLSVDAGGAIGTDGKDARVGKGGSVSLQAASTDVATDGSGRLRMGMA